MCRDELLREIWLNFFTIYHPTIDCVYAGNAYPYKLFGLKDRSLIVGNMIIAGKYVRHSWKLVCRYSEAGDQSQKSQILVNIICLDPNGKYYYCPERYTPDRVREICLRESLESITNLKQVTTMEAGPAGAISNLDDMQLIEVDTAVSRASLIDGGFWKSMLDFKLSREIYDLEETAENLEWATDITCP